MGEPNRTMQPAAARRSTGIAAEAALRSAMELHGPALLRHTALLQRHLEQRCPEARQEIAVLLLALEEHVPQALLAVQEDTDSKLLAPRLQRRLSERHAVDLPMAEWAVRAWADGLGLWASAPPVIPNGASTLPPPTDVQRPSIRTAPGVGGAAPIDGHRPEPATATATAAGPPRRPRGRSFDGRFRIRAAIGAALVAVVAILFWTGERPTPQTSADRSESPVAPVEATGRGSVATDRASVATELLPRIIDVATAEPLTADGRSRDVVLSFEPGGSAVRSVESRFAGGDGKWDPEPLRVEVDGDAANAGRVVAGKVALRSARAAQVSFEYRLTDRDGRTSAPFLKVFDFAAAPQRPPSITAIAVPDGVVAGQAFAVTIDYRDGDGRLAAIERRTVASDGRLGTGLLVTRTSELLHPRDGTLRYPIDANVLSAGNTLEFTLVDDDGVRGDPMRVALTVPSSSSPVSVPAPVLPPLGDAACTRATCGNVIAVRPLRPTTDPTLAARIADVLGIGTAPPAAIGRPGYEIVVRMDDRTVRTVRHPVSLRGGSRVRLANGRLIAIDLGIADRVRGRADGRSQFVQPRPGDR